MSAARTNPLKGLQEYGQSVWLDFVSRELLQTGGLGALITRDGLRGVTSNPSIFEKAILHGADYDPQIAALEEAGDLDPGKLFELLAVKDIQDGADALRPVYDETQRRDGYISLEVSPYLAMDTDRTIEEVRRLWREVGRDNLMVKIPGTKPGLPAIRQMIGEGINVNVTLLFSQNVYAEVAEAYIAGLEALVEKGGDPQRVASVASFFVSRIDTLADAALDEKIAVARDPAERGRLEGLKGKVAIANAKLAYAMYKRLFSGERWQRLAQSGAQTQRLLWASTGTKNPAYSDVLYVEELIGADTVNTVPPATMDAFREHGRLRPSLGEDVEGAKRVMDSLPPLGISIDAITSRLVEDGVRLFAEAADGLYAAVQKKRRAVLGARLDGFHASLPPELEREAASVLDEWRHQGNVRRLWAGDAGLWTGGEEGQWLGWLDIAEKELEGVAELERFAAEVKADGYRHVALLGMGGSSLGPEVLGESFPAQPGFPRLHVLDSTDPQQLRHFEEGLDLARTLFIVSSKSGSTLEPNIFRAYFFARAAAVLGEAEARRRFVAITDPGSSLDRDKSGFGRIFHGAASIGGRYSVLSKFGLVPAAAIGIDVARFLQSAARMIRSCAPSTPPAENPGVVLGAILGAAAKAGRDKVTILASPALADFGAWLEQLLAESTGKQAKGIVPIDAEPLGPPPVYGKDRLFAYLKLADEADKETARGVAALAEAGHPVVEITLPEPMHLGQEFFRWEMATAVAGAVIGIDPFDQPDVEASKVKTRELTSAYEATGKLPEEAPFFAGDGVELFADPNNAAALKPHATSLAGALRAHLRRAGAGDYVALLAYIERSGGHVAGLQKLRRRIRDKTKSATCLGFGPRFLHSTGQAYKGGPNSGVFLQITAADPFDLEVPGQRYGFSVVKAAQARGDFDVLAERGRRALRVHLTGDLDSGLAALAKAVDEALA